MFKIGRIEYNSQKIMYRTREAELVLPFYKKINVQNLIVPVFLG